MGVVSSWMIVLSGQEGSVNGCESYAMPLHTPELKGIEILDKYGDHNIITLLKLCWSPF